MGFFIGVDAGVSTWLALRAVTGATTASPPPSPIIGNYNQEWPASPGYLKTVEGNGLLRIGPPVSTPAFIFNDNTPPIDDFFFAEGFSDPYPEDLVGRTVTTAGSAFTITAAMFTGGTSVGSGGAPPISVDWFTAIT